MRDLKYTDTLSSLNWAFLDADTLQSSACKAVTATYNANAHQVFTILSLPGLVTWVTTEWNAASLTAQRQVVGLEHAQPLTQEQSDEIGQKAMAHLRHSMNNPDVPPPVKVIQMTGVFEENFSRGNPMLNSSLETILKMVLVQVWTAFEVLAQDLWESVLNEHPHYLAGLYGATSATANSASKKEGSKQISLNELREHGYDLSKSMGTILKEKYKFTILREVRQAYMAAFGKDETEIKSVIMDKALDALAAVRHMLVHRAGATDRDFMSDSEGLPVLEPIRSLGVKQTALINGSLVCALVEPVLECGSALIYAVDRWLANHTKPI